MNSVSLQLDEKGDGGFYVMDRSSQVGEMAINISGQNLTVYHTVVLPQLEGKGLAKMMLDAMVDYARKNKLQVIPLCPYVHAQFKRHSKDYEDVWKKE